MRRPRAAAPRGEPGYDRLREIGRAAAHAPPPTAREPEGRRREERPDGARAPREVGAPAVVARDRSGTRGGRPGGREGCPARSGARRRCLRRATASGPRPDTVFWRSASNAARRSASASWSRAMSSAFRRSIFQRWYSRVVLEHEEGRVLGGDRVGLAEADDLGQRPASREPVRSASFSRRCTRCQAHIRSISGCASSFSGRVSVAVCSNGVSPALAGEPAPGPGRRRGSARRRGAARRGRGSAAAAARRRTPRRR